VVTELVLEVVTEVTAASGVVATVHMVAVCMETICMEGAMEAMVAMA
jgi:hypothetical protein